MILSPGSIRVNREITVRHVSRYHPLLVLLHWVLAVSSGAALFFGAVILAHIPNSDPYKIKGLRVHMSVGALILALTLVRLVVRQVTAHPPKTTTGSALLDPIAGIAHPLLYAVIIAEASMGLALAYQSGLASVVFAHKGGVPADLWSYWPRKAHYLLSRFLMALIALHVCGALYHTFILKDGLLRRIWFGKRVAGSEGN
jgi:cytochrome b561